jgi:hypothetical protein
MNRNFGKSSFLFLLLIAAAVVLKPVMVFAAVDSLVHPTLVGPKAMSSTLGVPTRSLTASTRMDKMEKDSTVAALLKAEVPKTGFCRLAGSSIKCPGVEIPRPRSPFILQI